MKYLLAILFLLSACAPAAESSADLEDASAMESQGAVVKPSDTTQTTMPIPNPIDLPELEECRTLLLDQEGMMANEPTYVTSHYVNMVEIPCGPAPGTGAYGYPMSLVVDWAEVENSPEGYVPQLYMPVLFFERDKDGEFVPVGYVTQAVPYWDERDLAEGYVHLLYKYAGAGQCGLLATYTSEIWHSPFQFSEARERTCDAPPCEDDSCYEPKNWDLVYSIWE